MDGHAPNRDAVESLLMVASTSGTGGGCLFVYLDDEDSTSTAKVSDVLPEKYIAAVAFCGGPIGGRSGSGSSEGGDSTSQKQPLQCVTLQPPTLLMQEDDNETKQEDGGGTPEESTADASAAANAVNSQAALLQALQLYSKTLFLPNLAKDQTVLQEKMRQLNVAIGQSQRSAKLPTVTLTVDSQLAKVATSSSSSGVNVNVDNVDWAALGLQDKLSDDDYLNTLQSQISGWIVQIRKLTVLPKSTPFPLIVEDDTDDDGTNNTNMADLEELSFWNALSQELSDVQQQLSSPPVALTLALLREAKRYVQYCIYCIISYSCGVVYMVLV